MGKLNSKNSTVVSALILLALEMSLYPIWINIATGYGQVVLNKVGTSSPSLDNNNGTSGIIKKLIERQLTVAASHNNTNENNNSTLKLKDHDLKDGSNKGPSRTGTFSLPFVS